MTLSGLDVIARCDDFETRAAGYELRGWQWAFLCQLDGAAELRDVAMTGGVDLDLAIDFVAESEAAGLVRVVSMTLREYRAQRGIPEPQSIGETLASYESAPPAWMIEHHEAVAEHDQTVTEHHEEPVSEWTPEAHAAEFHEAPAAEYHDEAVAEHYEPVAEHYAPVAEHYEPVAEHYEPVAEHYEPVAEHYEPVAEWTPDAHVAYHEEPVAEYHDAVAEQAVASYEWTPDAHVAEHQAAVPSYEWTPDAYAADAATTVAGLMSLQPHDDASAEHAHAEYPEHAQADVPEHTAAYLSGQPVSLSIGDDAEATPAATNGHSSNGHGYSWEPMSLVTTVDATPVEPPHDEQPAADVPDGISIQLSTPADDEHLEPAAVHDVPEPVFETHEQGSISFSFSPDSEPVALEPVRAMHAEASEASPLQPVVQESPAEAPQQLRMDAESAQNGRGDLVGNLIARAFTFRVK